ncbi:putative protein with DUF1433 [Staphylococcus aureus]|uniref:Uncharacterized protein n=1 Tax=Staphylococcus aureus TaxID=1280 RepID=A0A380DUK9_STAAU|nr:putative protein with DUF1433 [Staphylococcus aureus]
MKKKYILILLIVILIGMLVIAYAHNKKTKDHYIEIQEKRIDLYFKYNLNNYHSMKVTSFKRRLWVAILWMDMLITTKIMILKSHLCN